MKKINKELLYKTLKDRLDADMCWGRVGGAHLLVLQNGQEVCNLCQGWHNPDTGEKLKEDAIYRLCSMTKPVTGVAALIAMEKGWFHPDDLVEDYLPDYRDMYVGKEENGKVVPDRKSNVPLRIWHMLSHCNGIMAEVPLGNMMVAATPHEIQTSLASVTDYCAKQPLAFEPESYTAYTGRVSFDAVARIIEMKSGMTYAEFLDTYLFKPLGLKDFTFQPTQEQWDRMIMLTDKADGNGLVTVNLGKRTFESLPLSYTTAGAGLVSSMHDYAVFAEMLRNRGRYGDVQIFEPEHLELMTRPRVPDGTPGRDPVSSWGLGVRVVVKDDVLPVGAFGWSGAYGTHFWVDPVNQITAIYMRASRWYDSHGCGTIGAQFEKDVMACLE